MATFIQKPVYYSVPSVNGMLEWYSWQASPVQSDQSSSAPMEELARPGRGGGRMLDVEELPSPPPPPSEKERIAFMSFIKQTA